MLADFLFSPLLHFLVMPRSCETVPLTRSDVEIGVRHAFVAAGFNMRLPLSDRSDSYQWMPRRIVPTKPMGREVTDNIVCWSRSAIGDDGSYWTIYNRRLKWNSNKEEMDNLMTDLIYYTNFGIALHHHIEGAHWGSWPSYREIHEMDALISVTDRSQCYLDFSVESTRICVTLYIPTIAKLVRQ
jgi:hypothetical protein